MESRISLVIPVYNGVDTIGACLDAVYAADNRPVEVIVVDDGSTDNSTDIIKRYPCRLVRLGRQTGSSTARNIGARHCKGEILMFIDADCLLREDTLFLAEKTVAELDPSVVVGGTYSKLPVDKNFFSTFQSLFIHFFESKNAENPDYVAGHALIMSAAGFKKSGGFPEHFLPLIEDVAFSHHLRRSGYRLLMNPDIQVGHIFSFDFFRSFANAYQKTKYWMVYSLSNRDLLADSGTASRELKFNVAAFLLLAGVCLLKPFLNPVWIFGLVTSILVSDLVINRNLFYLFFSTRGARFAFCAGFYYMFIYPIPICMGVVAGIKRYIFSSSPGLRDGIQQYP